MVACEVVQINLSPILLNENGKSFALFQKKKSPV
jgi:hypothetical protein